MDHCKFFPAVIPKTKRNILVRLRGINQPIPSIFTFLEDTKYLEPYAKVMKTLLLSGFKGSIKAAVESRHCQKSIWKEQISEDDTILRKEISWHIAYRKAYQQLWLFSLRHFPEITGCSPRKDPGRPKPRTPAIESSWWSRLAALAADCGFVGLSGLSANSDSADAKMARDFLR